MSKMTLTFDMEKEAHEATQAIFAGDAWSALERIYQTVRLHEKYETITAEKLCSDIREQVMEAQKCLM